MRFSRQLANTNTTKITTTTTTPTATPRVVVVSIDNSNNQIGNDVEEDSQSSQTDQFYAELKANTMINRMNESTMHNNKKLSKDEKEEKKDTTQMQNSRSEMKINEIWPVNSTLMMDEKATSSSW
ncbi:unnamed protein product [Trichobilharzia regenti]|nr:unnamed protein product [Trichobilharzia regenti]